MEKDSIKLAVHEHQALVIKHDNSTLIKSRHFHNELCVHCYAAFDRIAACHLLIVLEKTGLSSGVSIWQLA